MRRHPSRISENESHRRKFLERQVGGPSLPLPPPSPYPSPRPGHHTVWRGVPAGSVCYLKYPSGSPRPPGMWRLRRLAAPPPPGTRALSPWHGPGLGPRAAASACMFRHSFGHASACRPHTPGAPAALLPRSRKSLGGACAPLASARDCH